MVQASLILTITLSTNCQLYGKKFGWPICLQSNTIASTEGVMKCLRIKTHFSSVCPGVKEKIFKKKITHFHCKTNMATLWYKSPYPLSHVILCSSNPNTQLVCPMPRSREDLSILKKKSLHYIYGQVPRVTEQPLPRGSLNVTMF